MGGASPSSAHVAHVLHKELRRFVACWTTLLDIYLATSAAGCFPELKVSLRHGLNTLALYAPMPVPTPNPNSGRPAGAKIQESPVRTSGPFFRAPLVAVHDTSWIDLPGLGFGRNLVPLTQFDAAEPKFGGVKWWWWHRHSSNSEPCENMFCRILRDPLGHRAHCFRRPDRP